MVRTGRIGSSVRWMWYKGEDVDMTVRVSTQKGGNHMEVVIAGRWLREAAAPGMQEDGTGRWSS